MTTARDKKSYESHEVVRLKVEGAGTAVNTLRDQQTARGVSLICPFPALEVDIPVTFGSGDDQRRGAIHRIGVEDDPRTGLPRLRLSVRAFSKTAETRATVVSPPEESLLGEASRATSPPEGLDRAETDLDLVGATSDTEDLLDELLGGKRGRSVSTGAYSGLDADAAKKDPQWAAIGEISLPSELVPRAVTRRRKRIAGVAAWAAVAGLVAAGAFVLDRAGVVSLEDARRAAFDTFTKTEQLDSALTDVVVAKEAETAAPADHGKMASAVSTVEYQATGGTSWDGSVRTEVSTGKETPEAALAVAEKESVEEEAVLVAVSESEAAADKADEAGDAVIILPTRWPAEYSTAYRLRDPNGVVVDVPGGLVRREGWIDAGAGHPMIRSVRAVQRESGARFVVYVNGELPRFVTASITNGVQLRLYREDRQEPVSTEQVAMID